MSALELLPRVRETLARRRERARAIVAGLKELYPDAHCELDFRDPYELLVATILSAQSTDKTVNQVTPALFRAYPRPEALALADPRRVEALIKPTGFFRNKTRSLIGAAAAIAGRFDGRVPAAMEELLTLPGVGRKTANVVIGNAFGGQGVTVDTHVQRLSRRLGLTRAEDPAEIEMDLVRILPEDELTWTSHGLIWHGRRACTARAPRCDECGVRALCPSYGRFTRPPGNPPATSGARSGRGGGARARPASSTRNALAGRRRRGEER